MHLDLEKSERDIGRGDGVTAANKSHSALKPTEKSGRFSFDIVNIWPCAMGVEMDFERFVCFLNLGHSTSSLPLPMSMGNWPGGLPPMGYDCFCLISLKPLCWFCLDGVSLFSVSRYMAPLQGVVPMEGGPVAPAHIPVNYFSCFVME